MADDLMTTLLARGESKNLDFKGPMGWEPKNDKAACCGLVKDILAMANTMGGRIVVGVEEVSAGLNSIGLSPPLLETWDTTKVNQFLSNYADPPINSTMLKREHEGNCFVIIEVPGFPDMPHVCKKDFPGVLRRPAIYVRTDNNESAEVATGTGLNCPP